MCCWKLVLLYRECSNSSSNYWRVTSLKVCVSEVGMVEVDTSGPCVGRCGFRCFPWARSGEEKLGH